MVKIKTQDEVKVKPIVKTEAAADAEENYENLSKVELIEKCKLLKWQYDYAIEYFLKYYNLYNELQSGKRILNEGEWHISQIQEGSVFVEEFYYDETYWNKYLLQLNGVDKQYEWIIPINKRQPQIGDYIKHRIVDTTIKNLKYLKKNDKSATP